MGAGKVFQKAAPSAVAEEENDDYISALRRNLFPDTRSEDLLRVMLRDEVRLFTKNA